MSSSCTTHFISNEANNSWSEVTSAQKTTKLTNHKFTAASVLASKVKTRGETILTKGHIAGVGFFMGTM